MPLIISRAWTESPSAHELKTGEIFPIKDSAYEGINAKQGR
jgi:hypothetical protein